ncbi:hypothetical protein IKU74_02155 [bacterium]|nr:hypothetical protein [bacterium]
MADFFSDYSNNKGKPQLDKDYWKSQHETSKPTEPITLFDNMINTNFDIENLKNLSLFRAKK